MSLPAVIGQKGSHFTHEVHANSTVNQTDERLAIRGLTACFTFCPLCRFVNKDFFFWTIFLLQLWRGWPGFKTGRNYMGRHIYNHLWFPQLSSRDSDLVPERSHCISRYTFIAPATRQKTHLVFFWEYEMQQNMKQALPILWLPHSKALPWMIVGS